MDTEKLYELPFPSWNFDHKILVSHLHEIIKILAEYSWIYSTKNTDIFVYNILEKIPSEWLEPILELSVTDIEQLLFGLIKDDWPSSLKTFILKCTQLAEIRFPKFTGWMKNNEDILPITEKNTPLKKQTEIMAMSSLVYQICRIIKCHKVLDIGSGLGYIDELLHHKFGLKCVGLDRKECITARAKCRLKEDPCAMSMCHETLDVKNTDECIEKLKVILKNAHNTDPSCQCKPSQLLRKNQNVSEKVEFVMIGLHCCGDLTQDMMKLFCSINDLKALICVGCCYNKINLDEFPMSKSAQHAIHSVYENYSDWHPCVLGLRLGTQGTRSHMKNLTVSMLENREKSFIYRAILECYIKQESITWKKPKRRVREKDLESFENFCNKMFSKSKENEFESIERMRKLKNIYASKQDLFPRVRILIILQMLLQPLWECFVLLDRKLFFLEKSILAEVYAVWDDSHSARNMAICAFKI